MLNVSPLGWLKGARRQGVSQLRNLVDGKSVALIGNAESLFDLGLGKEIDGHDVVIRLNRGFVRDAASQGSRTDVIGTGQPLSLDQINNQYRAKLVYWLSHRWWRMPRWSAARWQAVEVIPYKNLTAINKEVRLRPTSGYVMIRNLMEHTRPREVNIYGFDFYKTPNFYAKPRDVPCHDTNDERERVLRLLDTRTDYILRGSDVAP